MSQQDHHHQEQNEASSGNQTLNNDSMNTTNNNNNTKKINTDNNNNNNDENKLSTCEYISKEWTDFKYNSSIAIADVRHGIHRASWRIILLVVTGILMSIFGASFQLVSMNQWLAHFPDITDEQDPTKKHPAGGPYVVVLSGGLSSLLLYILVYIFWQIKYRPGWSWLGCWEVWKWCGLAGVLLSLNGLCAVYSTPNTAETVQAMLIASQIVWTLIFAIFFLKQGKNYKHFLVISSISLSIVGIVVGTLATPPPPTRANLSGFEKFIWAAIYCLGVIFGSLINIVAAKFFMSSTYDEEEEALLEKKNAEEREARKRRMYGEDNDDDQLYGSGRGKSLLGSISTGSPNNNNNKHNDYKSATNNNHNAGTVDPSSNALRLNTHLLDQMQNNKYYNNTSSSLHIKNNKKFNMISNLAVHPGSGLDDEDGAASMNSTPKHPHGGDSSNNNFSSSSKNKNKNGGANDDDDDDEEILLAKEDLVPVSSKVVEIGHAKILFLLIGTFVQCISLVIAMPLDFAPFFGFAKDSHQTISELRTGFQCMFNSLEFIPGAHNNNSGDNNHSYPYNHTAANTTTLSPEIPPSCQENLIYFVAFAVCFALTNAGNVIVNQFSAPLTSVVAQIASPVAAVLLEVFPSLAPEPQQSNVVMASCGAFLLIIGAFLFGFFEELTSERKYELTELVQAGALTRVETAKEALERLGDDFLDDDDEGGDSDNGNDNDDDETEGERKKMIKSIKSIKSLASIDGLYASVAIVSKKDVHKIHSKKENHDGNEAHHVHHDRSKTI